jgi:hypothetical protein
MTAKFFDVLPVASAVSVPALAQTAQQSFRQKAIAKNLGPADRIGFPSDCVRSQ